MQEAEALLRLQSIDLELLKLASALQKLPQQQRLATIDLARKKCAAELTGIVGQRKDEEIAIADLEGDLAHYLEKTKEVQEAANQATTHREVRDFEAQLSSLAKRREKCEFTLGPMREKLAKLQTAEKNAQLMVAKLDEERTATEAALSESSADIKAKIRSLAAEREETAADVSAENMAAYETARKRFKGLAVERLRGNVPSICRVKLQASLFHDLSQRGDEITTCPYCHRILITSEGAEAE